MFQLYNVSVSRVLVGVGGREEKTKVISTEPNMSCISAGSILFTLTM